MSKWTDAPDSLLNYLKFDFPLDFKPMLIMLAIYPGCFLDWCMCGVAFERHYICITITLLSAVSDFSVKYTLGYLLPADVLFHFIAGEIDCFHLSIS